MFSKEVPASDTNLDYRAKRFGSSHEGISLTAFLFVCLFVCFVCCFNSGGVGFDINCGVRLLRTNLDEKDVSPLKDQLAQVSIFYYPPHS